MVVEIITNLPLLWYHVWNEQNFDSDHNYNYHILRGIYIPIDIFYLLHKPNKCLLKWIGGKTHNQDLKVIGSPRFSVTNVAWFLYILLWVSVPFPATKKFNKLIWSSHVCNIYQPLIEPPTCFFKLSPLMPAMMINYFALNPKVRMELHNL